jgi:hypothetical protein
VAAIPEDTKIIVFNKGNKKGFKGVIPAGGQTQPIQIEGERATWKKHQKKLKKNINSENKNKHIP